MKWNEYRTGVAQGLPVGLGYFSVSFGFGAMAVSQGLRIFDATLISLTNVTSAGQFAGLTVIVAAATLWEMILTQLIINSRYALMSLALSQRMGQRIGFLPRLLIAFFNTDEIFALAMARVEPLTVPFMLGLGTLPILGYHMYLEGQQFYSGDGIVTKGADNTVYNIGKLAREGMRETDRTILEIMLSCD